VSTLTLVTIPVSVTDRDGRYIPNLRKKTFASGKTEFNKTSLSSLQSTNFFGRADARHQRSTRFDFEDIQDAAITFVNQFATGRSRNGGVV